jgi:hypothetical protein
MAAFFIPGIGDDPQVIERAYGDMRRPVELKLGLRPNVRRIVKLWTRRGSLIASPRWGHPTL